MTRLLLLVMCAAVVIACEPTAVGLKPARDRSAQTEGDDDDTSKSKSKSRSDDDDADGDDDDDDDIEPTSEDTPATPAPAPKDPFEGAPAFAGGAPDTESSDHHLGASNAGKECMSCHAAGKGAPQFVLGGTVQRSKANAAGAPGVEVRVIDDKGAQIALTTTDASGNFWFKGAAEIPGGSRVALRDAAGAQKMSGAIATGACNSAGCHTRSLPIFLAP